MKKKFLLPLVAALLLSNLTFAAQNNTVTAVVNDNQDVFLTDTEMADENAGFFWMIPVAIGAAVVGAVVAGAAIVGGAAVIGKVLHHKNENNGNNDHNSNGCSNTRHKPCNTPHYPHFPQYPHVPFYPK